MTIWLINKENRTALGKLDYLPQIGERLVHQVSGSMYELECQLPRLKSRACSNTATPKLQPTRLHRARLISLSCPVRETSEAATLSRKI